MNKRFWQFRAAADNGRIGELYLYGVIGADGDPISFLFEDITPKGFKEDLDALGDIDTLRVYINSEGGDVFSAQAIYTMLKRHPAKVEVYVDGLAASAATLVAMAGDVIHIPRNAMMMVHNPWTLAFGDATFFRKVADMLEQVRDTMLVAYENKTGQSREQLIEILDAETWMTAEEAVKWGFADEINEAKAVAASLRGSKVVINGVEMDLSRYKGADKFREALAAQANPPDTNTVPTAGAPKRAPLSLYERRVRVREHERRWSS